MDCVEKFRETSLPPKEAFYSSLTEQNITDQQYQHAQNVWESFGCQNLGDYVRLDMALLADVVEETRRILYQKYELDISHYFSLPMIANDALFKHTQEKIDLLYTPDVHLWVEDMIRGGFCGAGGTRISQANNKYMGKDYNPEEESSYILYIDANNLCKDNFIQIFTFFLGYSCFFLFLDGWAMSQNLPTRNIEWVSDENVALVNQNAREFIMEIPEDNEVGYMFEVDLEIPTELHDKFNGNLVRISLRHIL